MSLNPALVGSIPAAVDGEYFILRRDSIDFTVDVEGVGKFKSSKGSLFFTTLRMVFISKDVSKNRDPDAFYGFDIPLAKIQGEEFHQPIFGANNLTGSVEKWRVGPSNFKITFRSGGVGTFLPLLIRFLDKHRRQQMQSGGQFYQFVHQGGLIQGSQAAFVDPSDPSVIFISQPFATEVAEPVVNDRGEQEYTPVAQPLNTASPASGSRSMYSQYLLGTPVILPM